MQRLDQIREFMNWDSHPISSVDQFHKVSNGSWSFRISQCFILLRMELNTNFVDYAATELNFICSQQTLFRIELQSSLRKCFKHRPKFLNWDTCVFGISQYIVQVDKDLLVGEYGFHRWLRVISRICCSMKYCSWSIDPEGSVERLALPRFLFQRELPVSMNEV